MILLKPNSELQLLKKDLLLIRGEYESKISDILDKIESLEKKTFVVKDEKIVLDRDSVQEEINAHEIEWKEVVTDQFHLQETMDDETQADSFIQNEETVENQVSVIESDHFQNEVISENVLPVQETPQRSNVRPLKEILKSIPLLSFVLEELGAPLLNLLAFFKKIYGNYKEKKQLPVFFMTAAGIGALLFGFGYLMQLSIGYFGELSVLVKIIFGFVCSSGIAFWATRLYKKGERYQEFSSALIGLAVSLNYLFVYFLSNVSDVDPVFSSPNMGFILIVINTILAIFFSLRYQTKIVAVLSLLGGAFAPFYLNTSESSSAYFAYLWLLCASSIYIARKIKWQTLGVISFLTASSIIELAVYNNINAFAKWEFVALFHGFVYLFLWFSLFNGKKLVQSINKPSISLIASNISLFLFNLYYLFADTDHYSQLGVVYVLNAVVFFPVLWMIQKQLSKQIKLLILVIAGTFVGFAIPAIFDAHLMGFFWSVEALGLVFLGYLFSMPEIRKEGYLLLMLALAKVLLAMNNLWMVVGSESILTSGFFNLLTFGVVLGLLIFLLEKYKHGNLSFENMLLLYAKNTECVWFITTYILTALYFTIVWLSFVSIVGVLLVIAVAYMFKLDFSIKFGRIMFIACVAYSFVYALFYIPQIWDQTIYGSGFANLVGIGVFLLLLQGLIYALHTNRLVVFKRGVELYLARISVYISIWFIVTLIVFVSYYNVYVLAFFTVSCSILYLVWGKWQNVQIKKIGYFIYLGSIIYAVLLALFSIEYSWNDTLLSVGYLNLIGIGIFAGSMVWAQKVLFQTPEKLDKKVLNLVINLWPLWFLALFMVTGYYTVGNFTLNMAIVPMFGFIYWGHKQKLVYTEYVGLAYSSLIVMGIALSVQECHSFRFTLQSTSGKIAMVELLFCLWFFKVFYDKFLSGNKRSKSMDVVREVFYWVIPLLIISPVKRYFPEYLGVVFWVAVFINFIIYEKTKRNSLVIEFKILLVLSVVFGFVSEKYYFAIPTSLVVLGIVFMAKKGYEKAMCFKSKFTPVFIGSVYYAGACVLIMMNNAIDSLFYGVVMSSIYFTLVVMFRKHIMPVRNNFLIAFYASLVLSISGLALSYGNQQIVNQLFVFFPLILLGVLLYSTNTVYSTNRKTIWMYLIILTHTLFLIGYSSVLHNSWLTIALILHAILVLFNSMKRFCKPLIWQSVAFFAIAIVKLLMWDMAHFSMLQKVVVFVVIGGLLIGASFLYMKLKDKFEEVEEDVV